MDPSPVNLAGFYGGWRLINERLTEAIGALSPEQLQLSPAPHLWPIWATAAHLAGARVYWLCAILKEPGAGTPFTDPTRYDWEDEPTGPPQASELTSALESSWKIVESCLARWKPEMLQDEFRREVAGEVQIHTRQSVLMRLITHDGYHCGEISLTLGMHGLQEPDLWAGRARVEGMAIGD